MTPMLDSVRPIDIASARAFVKANHYSEVMPRITKLCLGGYLGERLVAVCTLGFGTRPKHTIQKLFPPLGTDSYLELGKLCLLDELPRNSESYFIARIVRYLQEHLPHLKVLFSWADGIIGKPGIVYSASNFYYGGYIWTEAYFDKNWNRVHVRSIQGHPGLPQSKGKFKTRSYEATTALGYTKYFGMQFRYVYPLCGKKEWRLLQAESPFEWRRNNYPKHADCKWKVQTGKGRREPCELPSGTITTKYLPKITTGEAIAKGTKP
jgi:hypothetical protein